MNPLVVRALRYVALAGLILLAILSWGYAAVFNAVKGEVALWASYTLGAGSQFADVLGVLLAIASSGFLVRHGWLLAFGMVALPRMIAAAGAAVVFVGALAWIRTDWMFGDDGKNPMHLCRPLIAGAKPRVQAGARDQVSGEACLVMTPQIARTVYAMRRGVVPERITLTGTSELDQLEVFDRRNGMPIIFEGAPTTAGELPQLYRGAGWDPFAPGLLRELTEQRRRDLRAALKLREEMRQEREEAAQRRRDDQQRKFEARERAAAVAAMRRALHAVQSLGEPYSTVATILPEAGQSPGSVSPVVAASARLGAAQTDWRVLFRRDVERDPAGRATGAYLLIRTPENVPLGTVLQDVMPGVRARPLIDIAQPALFALLDLPAMVRANELAVLQVVAMPPGLDRLYFIDITAVCTECRPAWADVRWYELEAATRQAVLRSQRRFW